MASLLTVQTSCQRGCRGFDSRLVLQIHKPRLLVTTPELTSANPTVPDRTPAVPSSKP